MNESERPVPADDENARPIEPAEPAKPAPAAEPAEPAPAAVPPIPPASPYGAPQAPAPYAQQPTPSQPPAPYGGPQAPAQPFGQAAAQQPYGSGQPQQPPAPYAQPGSQYVAGYGQQPPYPAYPAQPPYPAASQPPRKKVWPWVLGGCLLMFVLGIGGCVGCAAFLSFADNEFGHGRYYETYDDRYDYGYGYDNGSGNGNSGQPGANAFGGLTLDDIKDAVDNPAGTVEDGRCSGGVYEIGPGKDIDPGLYFLEGGSNTESSFYVFDHDSDTNTYTLDDAVVYFGNYFTELDAGDVIAYMPDNDALRMYPVAKAEFAPEAPYANGVYRVGTDIPAGTYTITANDAAAAASYDSAAYVMKDLDFDDDSITESKYVLAGGSQTVTVKSGDFLELYAATATPAE